MKLYEIFSDGSYDAEGFIMLSETVGVGSSQSETMRGTVERAKELVSKLDDKMATKFRKEFNTQLSKFSAVLSTKDIRKIDKQLVKTQSVIGKYKAKV